MRTRTIPSTRRAHTVSTRELLAIKKSALGKFVEHFACCRHKLDCICFQSSLKPHTYAVSGSPTHSIAGGPTMPLAGGGGGGGGSSVLFEIVHVDHNNVRN